MDFQQQLQSKTEMELKDIYINDFDYQEDFVAMAKQELVKRGVILTDIEQQKANNIASFESKMAAGKTGNELLMVLFFISAVMGGLLGIIAGLVYSQSKQYSPTGKKYYTFNQSTRIKGRLMIIIGSFTILLYLYWITTR